MTDLTRPGAVDGSGVDAGVPAHYGDPMREQRLLAEGLACVDLSTAVSSRSLGRTA